MLRNIPLRTKLLLILILPALGFLTFSGIYVADKYQTLREMSQTTAASAEALEISQVITTLQRERSLRFATIAMQPLVRCARGLISKLPS